MASDFLVSAPGVHQDRIDLVLSHAKLSLQANIRITIGGRTLSLAADNSCGHSKLRGIRHSFLRYGEGTAEVVMDSPSEEEMKEALEWLLTGKISEEEPPKEKGGN